MKIITYNLRSGGTGAKENQWQRMIQEFSPDILCVQETRHPNQYFTADELSQNKGCIHALVPHGKWGSAMLSRKYHLEPVPLPEFSGWVVGAKIPDFVIDGAVKPVMIFSIHAPSPGPYEPSVNKILDEIQKVRNETPLILAGDFNLTTALRHPSEAATKNTSGEKKLQTRLRREFGLINAWQAMHPNENLPQTLRWSSNPVPPYHCDAIFVSHILMRHLVSAEVNSSGVWGVMSDHNPIIVDLD